MERRGTLHGHGGRRRQPPSQHLVEAPGVKLSQRVVVWIGKINDSSVKRLPRFFQPDHGILIDHRHAGIGECMAIKLRQGRKVLGQLGHVRVDVHERDGLHARVAEHFAQGEAIAAAEDQHSPR